MKFDFVIGNPPYQENVENRGEQPPIYHYFYDEAAKVASKVELITPGRFLFDAGKTPTEWNKKMLASEHFKVLQYFEHSKEVFSSVDIKGGVAIGFINADEVYEPIDIFIKSDIVRSILNKVKSKKECSIANILYSNTSYKYDDSFFEENPGFIERVSGGSKRYLSSSVFEKFPEAFLELVVDNQEYSKIIGRLNNRRTERYFKKRYLNPPDNFEYYKVLMSSSNGTGALGEVLTAPFVVEPYVGATETFISFGRFDNKEDAKCLEKYIKTKFLRLMLGTKKVTQGNKSAKVWENVPLQNFSNSSDINWAKSVGEVDQQLYKKYRLTSEEIDFIETNVKEME